MIDPVDPGGLGQVGKPTRPQRCSVPTEDDAPIRRSEEMPVGERRHHMVRCANIWEFACWLLDEPRRAAWGLAYVVVVLSAMIGVTWLVAPHLGGATSTALALVAAGMGGAGVDVVRRLRRAGGAG